MHKQKKGILTVAVGRCEHFSFFLLADLSAAYWVLGSCGPFQGYMKLLWTGYESQVSGFDSHWSILPDRMLFSFGVGTSLCLPIAAYPFAYGTFQFQLVVERLFL